MISSCRSSRPLFSGRPTRAPRAGPRGEQHHALRQPHGLPHVVGDEQDRRAGRLPDAQELALQHVAGDRVERGERLVHEQDARLLGAGRRGQRPGQRHALPHAARQLVRALGALPVEADQRQQRLGARSRRSRRPTPDSCSGSSTLRPAVSHGSSADSWNMNDGRAVRRSISPDVGCSRSATTLSSVDLPQPDAPSRHTNSPDRTVRSMSRSAVTAPGPAPKVLPTPRSTTRGRRELHGPVLHRCGHVSTPVPCRGPRRPPRACPTP